MSSNTTNIQAACGLVIEAIRIYDSDVAQISITNTNYLLPRVFFTPIECQAILIRCMINKNDWIRLVTRAEPGTVPDPRIASVENDITQWTLWPKMDETLHRGTESLISEVNGNIATAAFRSLIIKTQQSHNTTGDPTATEEPVNGIDNGPDSTEDPPGPRSSHTVPDNQQATNGQATASAPTPSLVTPSETSQTTSRPINNQSQGMWPSTPASNDNHLRSPKKTMATHEITPLTAEDMEQGREMIRGLLGLADQ